MSGVFCRKARGGVCPVRGDSWQNLRDDSSTGPEHRLNGGSLNFHAGLELPRTRARRCSICHGAAVVRRLPGGHRSRHGHRGAFLRIAPHHRGRGGEPDPYGRGADPHSGSALHAEGRRDRTARLSAHGPRGLPRTLSRREARAAGPVRESCRTGRPDPAQRVRLGTLQSLATEKIDELSQTVELKRAGQTEDAMRIVLTDRGKNTMDRVRAITEEMILSERQMFAERALAWRKAATSAFWITSLGSVVLLVLIAVAAAITSREFKHRQRESWLRAGQIGLGEVMMGDLPLERLGENVLRFLAQFLDAPVAAVFVAEGTSFRRAAGHGIPAGEVALVRPGDGLVGQAAKDNAPLRVRDVPPGYLPIRWHGKVRCRRAFDRSGQYRPACLCGHRARLLRRGGAGPEELLKRVSEPIAAAVRASIDRLRLQELLQETQQQAEELQTREEELRVNNEELEEQGRTLRESRAQLESQQVELEQINSQLEEQAHTLEDQKETLTRSHAHLAAKSLELQRANEYKSEFLANMSHELRTPLNSTLILAKLLADNKEGNLTDNQVRYAQTISSAGKDLLALINDVLDLSRIEAGKVEVTPESVSLAAIIEPLAKMFEPAAAEKKLRFATLNIRAGRSGSSRDRSTAPRTDPEEFAVERTEVHAARRGRFAGVRRGFRLGLLRRARYRRRIKIDI